MEDYVDKNTDARVKQDMSDIACNEQADKIYEV